jgi:hypothetical protein
MLERILVIILGWGLLCGLLYLMADMAEKWQRCPHGLRGGKTRNLCKLCIEEQKAYEEKTRIEKKAHEEKARMAAAADDLQRSEASRLEKLLLSIEELRSLSPWDFENVIARMFERMGFAVQQTPKVNDRGRDAILIKDGKKFLLECKKYGEGALRDVVISKYCTQQS